jgi:hypothetical protein
MGGTAVGDVTGILIADILSGLKGRDDQANMGL